MNTKKEYIAPKLTVFSYKSEDGFALSLMNNPLNDPLFDQSNQEKWDYDENNHFGNSDWNWD